MKTSDNNGSAKSRVYRELKHMIIWGEIPQGAPLREVPLAEKLKVSRTLIHEALVQLIRDGLAVSAPRRGTFVRSYTLDDICQLYELREVLEVYSLRKGIYTFSIGAINHLRSCCENSLSMEKRLPEIKTPEQITAFIHEGFNTDMGFHIQIITGSNNAFIKRVSGDLNLIGNIISIGLNVIPEELHMQQMAENLQRSFNEHSAIVDAIEKHDADLACALLSRHLRTGCRNILRALGGPENNTTTDFSGDILDTLDKLL